MGSCVSVHKDPASVMKLRMTLGSKTDKAVIPSPIKEKPISVVSGGDRTVPDDGLMFRNGSSFRDLSSKDEAFFDSQPWLESDCEDDFFSVNGDFTPSRGNTPVHHKFSAGSPRMNNRSIVVEKSPIFVSEPSPSPGEKKKRLSDLFKESLRIDHGLTDQENDEKMEASETPYLSGATSVCSSERTPNRGLKSEEDMRKSVQCCLPRMRLSRSFNERKKIMTPVPVVG